MPDSAFKHMRLWPIKSSSPQCSMRTSTEHAGREVQGDTWCNFVLEMLWKPTTFLTTAAGIISLVQATLAAASYPQRLSLILGLVAGILGLLSATFVHAIEKDKNELYSSKERLKKKKVAKEEDTKKFKEDLKPLLFHQLGLKAPYAASIQRKGGLGGTSEKVPVDKLLLQKLLDFVSSAD